MTAPAEQEQEQDADGADEEDHDAMEIALGAAIAALILAWLMPGPLSLFGGIARVRRSQLEAAIGQTVRGFIQRSTTDLAAASGQPGAHVAAADVAGEVYDLTMRQAERWIEGSYQRLQGRVDAGDVPDLYAGTSDGGKSELGALVDQAAANDARAVASYAKSESRDRTAGRVGALWSIWATRHDNRVRESHQELEGLKVPFGGMFVVGNGRAYLRFPGDPAAPPSETMGCRCRLKYRFQPKGTPLVV